MAGRGSWACVPRAAITNTWSVARRGYIVEIGYGSGSDFPQYAAFHEESGFLRLTYGRLSQWGTSIVLLPSFWANGMYFQGAPVTADWREEGSDLVVTFSGSIRDLHVQGRVRLRPPESDALSGRVTIWTVGDVNLDRRSGEAFKPVSFSSMHVSAGYWDARSALIDGQCLPIPDEGWIVQPPVAGRSLRLQGGSSLWKRNAPTLEITLDEACTMTGWKTASGDPSEDNLALWAAMDHVIRFWQYTATAMP